MIARCFRVQNLVGLSAERTHPNWAHTRPTSCTLTHPGPPIEPKDETCSVILTPSVLRVWRVAHLAGRRDPERPQHEVAQPVEGIHQGPYERDWAGNVFLFGDMRTRQVMVPRGDIDYLVAGETIRQATQRAVTSLHTRLPLCASEGGRPTDRDRRSTAGRVTYAPPGIYSP